MKVSVTMKRVLLVLMCLIMVFSIAACSERVPEELDSGPKTAPPKPKSTDIVNQITSNEGKAEITQTIRNKSLVQKSSGEDWVHMDVEIRYYLKDYLAQPIKVTEYSIILKGNINIRNNDATQFFLEMREVQTGKLTLGLYGYRSVTYLVIGEDKFYLNEVNITELALTIIEALKDSGIDPTTLVSGMISGNTGIEMVDGILKGVGFIIWGSQFTQTITDEGSTQIISAPMKINTPFKPCQGRLAARLGSNQLGGVRSAQY